MSIGQDGPQAPDVEKKSKSGTVDSFHQSEGRSPSDSRGGQKKEEGRRKKREGIHSQLC